MQNWLPEHNKENTRDTEVLTQNIFKPYDLMEMDLQKVQETSETQNNSRKIVCQFKWRGTVLPWRRICDLIWLGCRMPGKQQ